MAARRAMIFLSLIAIGSNVLLPGTGMGATSDIAGDVAAVANKLEATPVSGKVLQPRFSLPRAIRSVAVCDAPVCLREHAHQGPRAAT